MRFRCKLLPQIAAATTQGPSPFTAMSTDSQDEGDDCSWHQLDEDMSAPHPNEPEASVKICMVGIAMGEKNEKPFHCCRKAFHHCKSALAVLSKCT